MLKNYIYSKVMENITFVIPSRNNLEFLKLAYESIKALGNGHEILVLDDFSSDGTTEWLKSLNDDAILIYRNDGPDRIGIVGMFDSGIELARTKIIMAFHADMVAGPGLDSAILRDLKKGTVVTATRVEPPLHPAGPEKIIENFGIEANEFDYNKWSAWCNTPKMSAGQITEGIFAPWCMYKEDFEAIGGHDELFAPQSREDSDLFSRFHLNGYKFIQTWDGLVYHFTSRGSRFNKHAGGSTGVNSQEWIKTNSKNERNYIRKWGTFPGHDQFLKPIVMPKYDIGIVIKNCTNDQLELLEPWCTNIYTDADISKYFELEQYKTNLNLKDRCCNIHSTKNNNIEVRINGNIFNNQDFEYIRNLSQIFNDNGEIGTFELGNLEIIINSLESYEKELIINKEKKHVKN